MLTHTPTPPFRLIILNRGIERRFDSLEDAERYEEILLESETLNKIAVVHIIVDGENRCPYFR
jgi:hypothetical protein